MKVWHISDVHLSFDKDGTVLKPMDQRRWSIGSWTYVGYLEKMQQFAVENIGDDDITVITGDITHDMKENKVCESLYWLRKIIKGTLLIIRGNHDVGWDVGRIRTIMSHVPNFFLMDEGEILTIGNYSFGCYSNHKEKTIEMHNMAIDGRYLEMAFRVSKQAQERGKIPVMVSHYPINPELAIAIGKAGVKAYLSGHVHCTAGNDPAAVNGVLWKWYDQSAKLTDDLTIEGCFFSTGTTDVLLAKHGKSFKHISALDSSAVKLAPVIPANIQPAEMIVMVGIPGSGKSTIAKVLAGKDYTRVNQDELGSRKTCLKVADEAMKRGESVVIDRCNFDKGQRDTWLALARKHKVPVVKAIVMHQHKDIAIARAEMRTDHPTIKDAITARVAVSRVAADLTHPQMDEGFTEIIEVPANNTVEQTLQMILGDLHHGV